jgi:hypothetical protein
MEILTMTYLQKGVFYFFKAILGVFIFQFSKDLQRSFELI